ncbi:MAG: hypothetical protein ABIE74_08775 [Pseudomonadota bacterium]
MKKPLLVVGVAVIVGTLLAFMLLSHNSNGKENGKSAQGKTSSLKEKTLSQLILSPFSKPSSTTETDPTLKTADGGSKNTLATQTNIQQISKPALPQTELAMISSELQAAAIIDDGTQLILSQMNQKPKAFDDMQVLALGVPLEVVNTFDRITHESTLTEVEEGEKPSTDNKGGEEGEKTPSTESVLAKAIAITANKRFMEISAQLEQEILNFNYYNTLAKDLFNSGVSEDQKSQCKPGFFKEYLTYLRPSYDENNPFIIDVVTNQSCFAECKKKGKNAEGCFIDCGINSKERCYDAAQAFLPASFQDFFYSYNCKNNYPFPYEGTKSAQINPGQENSRLLRLTAESIQYLYQSMEQMQGDIDSSLEKDYLQNKSDDPACKSAIKEWNSSRDAMRKAFEEKREELVKYNAYKILSESFSDSIKINRFLTENRANLKSAYCMSHLNQALTEHQSEWKREAESNKASIDMIEKVTSQFRDVSNEFLNLPERLDGFCRVEKPKLPEDVGNYLQATMKQ